MLLFCVEKEGRVGEEKSGESTTGEGRDKIVLSLYRRELFLESIQETAKVRCLWVGQLGG